MSISGFSKTSAAYRLVVSLLLAAILSVSTAFSALSITDMENGAAAVQENLAGVPGDSGEGAPEGDGAAVRPDGSALGSDGLLSGSLADGALSLSAGELFGGLKNGSASADLLGGSNISVVSGSDTLQAVSGSDALLTADDGTEEAVTYNLSIYQANSTSGSVVGTVDVSFEGSVIASSTASGYKHLNGLLVEGKSYTVTVTAPAGYRIRSITSSTNGTLTADGEYEYADTVRAYTLSGFAANQTVYVHYEINTISVYQSKSNTDFNINTAGISLNTSAGGFSGGSTWTIPSALKSSFTSSGLLFGGSVLDSINIDATTLSKGFAVTSVTVKKNGTVWGELDTSALPIASGETAVLSFASGAADADATGSVKIQVDIVYSAQSNLFTVEHSNGLGLSSNANTCAAVKLSVSAGTVQDGSASVTMPVTKSSSSVAVSTGASLESIALSGNVFNQSAGLGIGSISVYKNGVLRNDLLDDSSVEYPITSAVTIPFASGAVMDTDTVRVVLDYVQIVPELTIVHDGGNTVKITAGEKVLATSLGAGSLSANVSTSASSKTFYLCAGGAAVPMEQISVSLNSTYTGYEAAFYVDGEKVEGVLVRSATDDLVYNFVEGYEIPAGKSARIEITYDRYKTITLNQKDNDGNLLGTVNVTGASGSTSGNPFWSGAGSSSSSFMIGSTAATGSRMVKPYSRISYVTVSPQTTRSITSVTMQAIDADGNVTDISDRITWPENYDPTAYNTFTLNYDVPADTAVVINVEYGGWRTITLNQKDALENLLGTVSVAGDYGSSAGNPFWSGAGSSSSSFLIGSTAATGSRTLKPYSKITYVTVSPRPTRSIASVTMQAIDADGNVTDISDRITWPENYDPTAYNTFVLNYDVPADTDIVINVEYGGWKTITLNQKDTLGSLLGTVSVTGDRGSSSGNPFWSGAGSSGESFMIGATVETDSRTLKPYSRITKITVSPQTTRSITSVTMQAIDASGNVTDISDRITWPDDFDPTKGNTFAVNYDVPANTDVVINVEYGGWKTITLNQKDTLGSLLGTVSVTGDYGSSSGHPFWSGTGSSGSSFMIGSTAETGSRTLKPYSRITQVTVSPQTTRSITKISMQAIDADGNVTDISDRITWPEDFDPTKGNTFAVDYDVPAGISIVIDVEYGGWKTITLNQKDTLGSLLGTVSVTGNRGSSSGNPFWSSAGSSSSSFMIGSTAETGSRTLKPYSQITQITVSPHTTRSIISVTAQIIDGDGNEADISDLIVWPEDFDPTKGNTFALNYDVPANTDVVINVEYGGWKTITLNQKDTIGNLLGTVSVTGNRGTSSGNPFWSGTGSSGTSFMIGSTAETGSRTLKPYSKITKITVSPHTTRSIISVTAQTIDADGNETDISDLIVWPDDFDPTKGNTFALNYDVPANTDVVINVEYGEWKTITLNQKDTIGNLLGTVSVTGNRGTSSGNPFWSGTGSSGTSFMIGSTAETGSRTLKPYSKITQITVSPHTTRSIISVTAQIIDGDGNETDISDLIVWPDDFDPTKGNTFALNYDVPANTDVVINVEYGEWKTITLNQKDTLGSLLGTVSVTGNRGSSSGNPFWSGTGSSSSSFMIGSTAETGSRTLKPYSKITQITVSPHTTRSIISLGAKTIDADGNETDISDLIVWPEDFDPTKGNTFALNYDVPANTDVVINVEYGEWKTITLNQKDTLGNLLGTVSVTGNRGTSSGNPFWSGTGSSSSSFMIGSTAETGSRTLKPYSKITQITVSPHTTRSIISITAQTIDADGNETDISDLIVWPDDFDPTKGNTFGLNYDVPANTDVVINVEYGEWKTITLNQKDTIGSLLGTVSVTGNRGSSSGNPFWSGTGSSSSSFMIGSTAETGSRTLKPYSKITQITVSPHTTRSIISITAQTIDADGNETDISDLIVWPEDFDPTKGNTFGLNYDVPANTDVVINVEYGEWKTITLNQKDTLGSLLGTVSVTGNRGSSSGNPFWSGTGSSGSSFMIGSTAETGSRTLKPYSQITKLTVSPSYARYISSIKIRTIDENGNETDITGYVSWPDDFDPSKAVSLVPNYDVPANTAVVVDVEYGGKLYAAANVESVVRLGDSDLDGEFAFISDITSKENSVSPVVEDGWRIESVKYGSSETNCNTSAQEQDGAYAYNAYKDTYVYITVVRNDQALTARQEGEGAVSVTYKGAETALTASSATLDSAVVVGSEVKFALTAVENTRIVDVTVNGYSVGDAREFTMPGEDAEIVVKTELITKKLSARQDGSGTVIFTFEGKDTVLAEAFQVIDGAVTVGYEVNYTISAGPNTHIVNVYVDGVSVDGERSFTMPDRDVEIVVETKLILSARQDGPGAVAIVYGGSSTELTGSSVILDSEADSASTIVFELNVAPDTRIVDVLVNGVSLGSRRTFTMPDIDAEIVVVTEKAVLQKPWIEVLKTGDGEAFAAYADTTLALTEEARVIADDLAPGDYSVKITAAEGSSIVSVSVDGTVISPDALNADSYTVPVADENVTVTVDTRKKDVFTVYAKANIAGGASVNGVSVAEDYVAVAEIMEGEDALLELTLAQDIKLLETLCGADASSMAEITFTDGKYELKSVTSAMYVDITLASKPTIAVERIGCGVVYTNLGTTDVSGSTYKVEWGSDHTFEFIPYEGEKLLSVTVKRGDAPAQRVYTAEQASGSSSGAAPALGSKEFTYDLLGVEEDCVISAVFSEPESFTLHVIKKGDGSGTFTYDSVKYTKSFDAVVQEGSVPVLDIKPAKGSELVSVKVGDSVGTAQTVKLNGTTLTLPAMSKDVYVVVEFKKTGGSGGTPDTGDHREDNSALVSAMTNLALVSALVGVFCVARLRGRKEGC